MPSTIHHGEIVPSSPENAPLSGGASFYGGASPVGGAPGGAPAFGPDKEAAPSLSLRDFFAILQRRKWAALSVFSGVVALGVLATLFSKPVYRTGARLLVEGRANSLAMSNSDDPLSSVFQPKAGRDVDTQVEILRSPMVLDRVFKQTGVAPGTVDVDVHRVDRTDVIELSITSNSRHGAEAVAAALPLVYERDTRDDRLRDVSAALAFATNNLQKQTDKLERTERDLERSRNRSGVVDPGAQATGAVAAAAQSQSDLVKAEVDDARLKAQLDSLVAQRASLSPFLQTPITSTNPQVQGLKDELAALNSQRAQKLFLFKPTDDEVRQVDLQINDLKARLARTPATITNTSRAPNPAINSLDEKIGGARADYRASQNTLGPLRRRVASQNGSLGRFNTIARREAQLLRDQEASGSAVKTLKGTVLQLSLRQSALVASGAPVSTMAAGGIAVKIAPSPLRNALASLLMGLLLGCGAALLGESLDDHIRDPDEVRRLLNTSVLGYFALRGNKGGRPLLDLENPDRHLLESFRVLRSNVQFALVNAPGRRLLVTSAVPGEGKSYIACNLAISMALNGHNVILVDADLHRPRVHETFGIPNDAGLTNVLIQDAKLQDCVREVGVPGLRVITAGTTAPNPTELLSSTAMDALIDRLGQGANVVIFDSPPLLATADAQVLSPKVDGVVFVMHLGRTARSSMQRSFELLRQAQARVIGVVFNRMENQVAKSYQEYGDYYDAPPQTLLGASRGGVASDELKASSVLLSPANGFKRKETSSANGSPANGSPANGSPANGSPANGSPTNSAPANGSPANGSPANGSPANGSPANGSPMDGISPESAFHLDNSSNGVVSPTEPTDRLH